MQGKSLSSYPCILQEVDRLQSPFVTNGAKPPVCHVVPVIISKVLVSKICGDEVVRTPASTDVNLRSRRAYHIAVAIERVQKAQLVAAGIWLIRLSASSSMKNDASSALSYPQNRTARRV